MARRASTAAAVAVVGALGTLPGGCAAATATSPQAAAEATRPLPAQIATRPAVQQMITVTSGRWGTTQATLRAWRRHRDGHWSLAAGPFPAVIGWNGWTPAKRRQQNTGTTPAGNFALPRAFGALADPGTAVPYERFDANDYWPTEPRDPATYNIYQRWKSRTSHWRPNYVERLWDYRTAYAYAAVIGFNPAAGVHYSAERHQWVATDPADTSRGGAIFLHARTGSATAGCVAVDKLVMSRLLRWLDPTASPRIVMGPRSYVQRL